ncbi:MAG: hypothetical protein ABEH43_00985 [Flavobacteriales bacterium]
MGYKYLGDTDNDGQFNYEIIFTTFIDCNSPFWGFSFPEPSRNVGVYEGPKNPSTDLPLIESVTLQLTDSTKISPEIPNQCTFSSNPCLYEVVYKGTVDVPSTFEGYHLFYDRCCRNDSIKNLDAPGDQGMVFGAYIPPTLLENNSPTFSDVPAAFICKDDTTSIINTAVDDDGDLMVFSFVRPYKGFGDSLNPAPPLPAPRPANIPKVDWETNYNKNDPFGPNGFASINASTGFTQ